MPLTASGANEEYTSPALPEARLGRDSDSFGAPPVINPDRS